MRLRVWLPTEELLDAEVTRIRAEAENGWFCLLPKHIDFATALVPGIVTFTRRSGEEEFLAVDHGVLVKCGPDVSISTRSAVRSRDLASLHATVESQFQLLGERERKTRTFEAKLEADLVRRLIETEKYA
jgi:F-type H+-transporting ATPase subunit epsilon